LRECSRKVHYSHRQTINNLHTFTFTHELSLLNGNITSEEVLKEIKKLKNNKAPGEDGLPGEQFSYPMMTIFEAYLSY
jgi:collagenase-like PrtC family protease